MSFYLIRMFLFIQISAWRHIQQRLMKVNIKFLKMAAHVSSQLLNKQIPLVERIIVFQNDMSLFQQCEFIRRLM